MHIECTNYKQTKLNQGEIDIPEREKIIPYTARVFKQMAHRKSVARFHSLRPTLNDDATSPIRFCNQDGFY